MRFLVQISKPWRWTIWSRTDFCQCSTQLNKTEDVKKGIHQKLLRIIQSCKYGKLIKHVEWSPPKRLRHIQMAVGSPPPQKKNTSKHPKNNIRLADIFFSSVWFLFFWTTKEKQLETNQVIVGTSLASCEKGGQWIYAFSIYWRRISFHRRWWCDGEMSWVVGLLLLGRCWKGF